MKQFIYTGELQKLFPDAMIQTGLITKEDYKNISQYMEHTHTIIYFAADKGFVIDTPEITITHKNKKSFMDDINFNLECMNQ